MPFFLSWANAIAQVVTDGTAGPGEVLTGPDYDIAADLGTQAGDNLFHSFEDLSAIAADYVGRVIMTSELLELRDRLAR